MHVLWSVVRVLIGLFCCLSEMGGSSHPLTATLQYELDAFEFFGIILGTSVSSMMQVYKTRDLPFTHLIMISVVCYITHCPKLQRLPDNFMNMLMGEDPPNNVKLRQAGSGFRRQWDVELVIKEGHMYLSRGWEKFYRAYDLRLGYFLLFRYDDDATMLIVKVFNTTMCRMRYADDDDANTFCLFLFLYIWLCLISIVNGHVAFGQAMGAAAATLATAKAAAILATAKTTRRVIRIGVVGKKRSRVGIRLMMT